MQRIRAPWPGEDPGYATSSDRDRPRSRSATYRPSSGTGARLVSLHCQDFDVVAGLLARLFATSLGVPALGPTAFRYDVSADGQRFPIKRCSGRPVQGRRSLRSRASVVAQALKPISKGHRRAAANLVSTDGPFPFPIETAVHADAPRRVQHPLTS